MNERMHYVVRSAFGNAWSVDDRSWQDELIARVNRHFTQPREDIKPIFRVPKGVWSGG